jgi:zinc protease
MRIGLLVSLSCLMWGATSATAGIPDQPNWAPAMPSAEDFDLSNTILDFPSGLRVIIQEDHSHPIAGVYTYVGHGFNDDPVGAEETAHFVEHLWFRSVHGDLPPIMWTIQDMGTLFNATTAPDRTDYRTVAGIQYLPLMLKFESLRLTNFYDGVTEDQIDTEREVIRNEWRRRNEQNINLLFDYLNESVYPEGHPYSRHSTMETIDNIDLKVLQTYVDTYYKPEDTTITIVGDFKTDDVVGMIFETFEPRLLHPELTEEYMSRIPKQGIPVDDLDPMNPEHWAGWMPLDPSDETKQTPLEFLYNPDRDSRLLAERPEPPSVGKSEQVRKQAPVDEPIVTVGWSLPAGYYDDHFDMMLLGNVLSPIVVSGLQQVYGRDGIGNGSGCQAQPGLHATTMMCFAEVKDSRIDLEKVGEKLQDQVSQLWAPAVMIEGMDPLANYLAMGQQQYMLGLLRGMDTIAASFGSRAENIGEYAHWTGDAAYYGRAMEKLKSVDPTEVKEMGRKYLRRDRAATVIFEPIKTEDIDVGNDTSSYAGVSEDDALIEPSDNMELATAQEIARSWVRPALQGLQDETLDNGMRVVILPHGDTPKVNVQLIFGGGTSSDASGLHGFASRFSTDDSTADTTDIYGFGDWGGSPLRGATGSNSTTLAFTGFAGNLPHGLWKLREKVETAKPDMVGKSGYITDLEGRTKGNWTRSSWHQTKMRYDHLYPGSDAYRMMDWNDIMVQKSWGGDDVAQYLGKVLQPANTTLVIVGKVDPAQAMAEVKHYWSSFEPGSGVEAAAMPPLPKPAMPTEAARTLIFDDEKRTQTQTNMSCRLNYAGPEDDQAVQILGRMLGNQIMATLRVKEGLAYSPGGGASSSTDGSAALFFSSLAVNRGVGRTVEYFKQAIEKVDSGDIDAEEIKLHQIRLNRSSGVSSHSVDQMGRAIAGNVIRGTSWKEYRRYGRNIAAVRAADLSRLVEGCLDHAIVTLEGPKDVITAQLDERGFEYEVVDFEEAGDKLLWEFDPKAAKKKEKAEEKEERKKAKKGESEEEVSEGAETADAAE